jgi:hypothetical protein
MALAGEERGLICGYADESQAYCLRRVVYNVGYLTHTKDLTPDVDRIQDVRRKKWYCLDSAA